MPYDAACSVDTEKGEVSNGAYICEKYRAASYSQKPTQLPQTSRRYLKHSTHHGASSSRIHPAMAQNLAPLPQPGFSIYAGFIATKPETFVAKGRDSWSDKASFLISFSRPTGEPLAPFLEIIEEQKKQISFKTMQGQEVMRIVKQTHPWSGKGTEYHGMRGDGTEIWYLKLKQGWSSTDYRKPCLLPGSTIIAR